jgi:hypothetical protein
MGCKPHRVRQFKLSRIRGSPPGIGRYVDLQAHPVSSVDETSQIQALDSHATGAAGEQRQALISTQ